MLLAPVAALPRVTGRARTAWRTVPLESGLVLLVGLLWTTQLTWRMGGREPHAVTWTALAVGLLLVVQRPWSRLPRLEVGLAAAVGVAPWVVVATAPTGWTGRADAASYATAAGTYLAVRGWARGGARAWAVLGAVALAGVLEFQQGWLAWWGGQEPARPFEGTFYWHNQAGAFLAVGALVGLGVLALAPHRLRVIGLLAALLAMPGVLFTTSRGSQLGVGLGAALLGVGLLAARRWAAAARVTAATAAAGLASVVLSGPPFFPHRASPLAGTRARGHVEALSGNTVQRLDDWHRAWAIFRHWPLSGAGFHSFVAATKAVHVRTDGNATAFAHNSFLQALADGGAVLALPLVGGLVLALAMTARAALRRELDQPLVVAAVAPALLVALLHAGMDFDWTYPGLLALAAILLAALRAAADPPRSAASPTRRDLLGAGVVVGLTALVAVAGWAGGLVLNAPLGGAG